VGARPETDPGKVATDSDFFLLAVPDSAIQSVASSYRGARGIWMHVAGAVPVTILEPFFARYGVLYPLQTFSADREISLEETPILLEGSDPGTREEIRKLAACLSSRTVDMDSRHRLVVHLAAVFANNFSNQMVAMAQEILEEQGMDAGLILPILRETMGKIEDLGAKKAQTGPALRGDIQTMQKHLELLRDKPEWQKIYTFISHNIRNE
jgi:predicted short-subunit dehydrogenase-like oxidoreductase (DUF2520 family)